MKKDQKWWVLFAIGIGSLMAALDGSVVNSILPVLKNDLNSSIEAIQWVSTIYLLVLSALLLTFGRLGDIYGHRSVYLWGFIIFIFGSALCGVAWSVWSLILFRGFQAIGGAILASNAPAIVTGIMPANQRGRAFGLTSTLTYFGLMIGPSLGGWLAQAFNWRMVFFINIPIGLIASLLSIKVIPKDSLPPLKQRFDLLGAGTFLTGLVALLLCLNRGSIWGWVSPGILGLAGGSIIAIFAFVMVEKRTRDPMLDLSLFNKPLFSITVLSALINYICLFTVIFLIPFYLIQGRGLASGMAGLIFTAQPAAMAITAPISGYLSDKLGSRGLGMLGMAILSSGLFLFSTVDYATSIGTILSYLVLTGAGTGIFITPNTSALMGSAPQNRQGIASGVQATARNFGMVLGIGMAGAIFSTYLAQDSELAFMQGINVGFVVAGFIAILGIILSAFKEKSTRKDPAK